MIGSPEGQRRCAFALLGLTLLGVGCRCSELTRPSQAGVRASPAALEFGEVALGARHALSVELVGTGSASTTSTLSVDGPFLLDLETIRVAGGASAPLTVSFVPTSLGASTGTLVIATAGQEALQISLSGVGLPACVDTSCHSVRFDLSTRACSATPLDDETACAFPCLIDARCLAGQCVGRASSCEDRNECTVDACAADGGCLHVERICPVTSPCRTAVCLPATGCEERQVDDGVSCGSSDCLSANICLGGSCTQRASPQSLDCAYTSLAGYGSETCATTRSGKLRCWGGRKPPHTVPGPANAALVAQSYWGPCTVDGAGGALACTGLANPDGGLGAAVTQLLPPSAVLADGRLVSWDVVTGAVATRATGVAAVERFVDDLGSQGNSCLLLLDAGVRCEDRWGTPLEWPFPPSPRRLFEPSPLGSLCAEWDDVLRCAYGTPLGGDAGYFWEMIDPLDAGLVVGGIPSFLPSNSSFAARGRDVSSWDGRALFSMQDDVVAMTAAAGGTQTCLLTAAHEVWCWGSDRFGGLGQRTGSPERPVELSGPDAGVTLLAVSSAASSTWAQTAVVSGSTVRVSGGLGLAGVTAVATIGSVEALAVTSYGLCAIQPSGQAACCQIEDGGCDLDRSAYRLGAATAIANEWGSRGEPAVVDAAGTLWVAHSLYPDDAGFRLSRLATDVVEIVPGCARLGDGGVSCLSNTNGGFDPVMLPEAPVALSASQWWSSGACALLSGDQVICWQSANGSNFTVPVSISGLSTGIRQLVGSLLGGCALVGSNLVECWGQNAAGDGETTGTRAVPLTFGEAIHSLVMSNQHTCALMESGRVVCWGYNSDGQLGFWPLQTQVPVKLTR